MSDTKKIVILGAGYAGVEAAKVLNKKFKKDNNVEITLINSNPYHTLLTELHEIAGQRTEKESVMVDLYSIFKATKVNVVRDTVTSIDYTGQVLTSEKSSYKYDYLVLGCGAEPAFFGVEGVQENAFTIWSLNDALKIRKHVESMFEKARDERDAMKRKDLLSIIVAGAGFTGVEVVGELFDLKKVMCEKYDIDENEVTIYNVEAMPNILPMLRPALQQKATKFMQKKKVDVMTNAAIVKATPDGIVLKDGREIKAKTLIWTCGVQGNSFVPGTGIAAGTGKRNRIQVNDYMQSIELPNVYAIGDNAWYEVDGKPVPQVVETAIQTGECAAHNIAADITKTEKKKNLIALLILCHGNMFTVRDFFMILHQLRLFVMKNQI